MKQRKELSKFLHRNIPLKHNNLLQPQSIIIEGGGGVQGGQASLRGPLLYPTLLNAVQMKKTFKGSSMQNAWTSLILHKY